MAPREYPTIIRAAAVASLLIGLLLLLASWDGLYETFDLPQPVPALGAQLGGAALVGLAYVLWAGGGSSELADAAAGAGAIAHGVGALAITAWLAFRSKEELGIGTLGTTILIVTAVALGGLAAAEACLAVRSWRRRRRRPLDGLGAAETPLD